LVVVLNVIDTATFDTGFRDGIFTVALAILTAEKRHVIRLHVVRLASLGQLGPVSIFV
jgi:hypothetical protein